MISNELKKTSECSNRTQIRSTGHEVVAVWVGTAVVALGLHEPILARVYVVIGFVDARDIVGTSGRLDLGRVRVLSLITHGRLTQLGYQINSVERQ